MRLRRWTSTLVVMRSLSLLLIVGVACAQPSSKDQATYSYDVNGRRVLDGRSSSVKGASGSASGEMVATLDGKPMALQKVEERVISSSPQGSVVERIVRRYDRGGNPGTVEKQVIEENKKPGGGSSIRKTVYEADLNGRFALIERSTVDNVKTGLTERAEAVVERPNLSGSFEATEKRVSVTQGDDKNRNKDVTVYRKGGNGTFEQAEREIEEFKTVNGQTVSNTTVYNANPFGKMEFTAQKVATLTKNADGSEVEVIDHYGKSQPGRAAGAEGAPKLREQQIVERKPGPDKTVVETLSVRTPNPDSNKLGAAAKISETICSGVCK